MTVAKVLECNVQELNQMYYEQLKRVSVLSEQNRRYKQIIADLVESLTVGEIPTLRELGKIKEDIAE